MPLTARGLGLCLGRAAMPQSAYDQGRRLLKSMLAGAEAMAKGGA